MDCSDRVLYGPLTIYSKNDYAMMEPSKRNSLNSSYSPVTRMYENAVGKFLTYAEARQKQWQCEKCERNEDFITKQLQLLKKKHS